ncbi:hypothetical protein [Streptomyces sp. SID5910]|uniref:hypothetical protein n=1 Tax=Streptomyces sp. SID5910 TaxID=2690312 RepID=UPI00136A2BAE|nr:hypothetical protein [Streptomyces sp. SID5910]MYR40734.1 hypothetical protein [Streptomyces sp. SID5910]MYR41439.1 hypothetical protein [Streptomyces sp. SID5910]
MGVYPAPLCAAYGQYYQAYFATQGRRAYPRCIYVGGEFPLLQYVLLVTLVN